MSQKIRRSVLTAVVVLLLLATPTFAGQNSGRNDSNWFRDLPGHVWSWVVERAHDLVHITDVISIPIGTPTVSNGSGGQ